MNSDDIVFLDTLPIIIAALFTAAFSEGLSWLLIYRTDSYQDLKKNIELASKKVDKFKDQSVMISRQKAQDKKIQRKESNLRSLSQQLSMSKMWSTAIVGLFIVAFVSTMHNSYHGIVCAKIPFTPFGFLQRVTHRGLPGNDPTDCSMIAIYIMSSMIFRENLTKILGFAPKSSYNMWEPPKQ